MLKSNSTAPTVVVTLVGGLGNQLFQYAMGRSLSFRNNQPLVLDLAWFDQVKNEAAGITTIREYALEPFNLPVRTQCVGLPRPKADGVIGRILRRFIRTLPRHHIGHRIYAEPWFRFDAGVLALHGPVWLDGYWQSPKYFSDIAALLRKELGQPGKVSLLTRDMLKEIGRYDAICLHVRRGDYVTNQNAAAIHGLCSPDYYILGLSHVLGGLQNPHCFVFSDEPAWARSNLHLPVPTTVVDINSPAAAHEDLWLMSACSRFVIANSSLSWWGGWLSNAPNKVVVAPKAWFADGHIDTSDLIPTEWVRI